MPTVPDINFPTINPKRKKNIKKKEKVATRQERLLRLFDGDGYEEFITPKYVFVKHWNGNTQKWQVAIYTKESYNRYKQPNLYTEQSSKLKNIAKYG